MAYPLEPSDETYRAMLRAASEFAARHVSGLEDAPAADVEGADALAATFREPAPDGPSDFAALLERLGPAVAKSFNTAGPGYLAFIPGGGLVTSGIAGLIAETVNRYTGIAAPAPALAQIDATVVRWLCDAFGYGEGSFGSLTPGGSMSNLSAIVTARRAILGEDPAAGVLYVTSQTHHSVAKSAVVAGIAPSGVRVVATDDELRMDATALADAVAADRARGLRPFLVVASAGTTNTGAVDPLSAVADVAQSEGLWMHADGAYGGFFYLTTRGRALLEGIARADSITLDPHKGLFLPYGVGALVVREASKLRAAHSPQGDFSYLHDLVAGEVPDAADFSPELSRPFRGLRVWLPIMTHGMDAFRTALAEKLDLTTALHEGIRGHDRLEIPYAPQLSVVAFRIRGDGDGDATRALMQRVNASGRIFVSGTTIDGVFLIRACILSHRTHRDRVDEAVEIIRAAASA